MEELINLLKEIDEDVTIESKYGFIPEHSNQQVQEASNIATKILITEAGKCEWRNIGLLELEGFDVFPVESDRFGWLIGGIQTRRGVITFG